MLGLSLSVFYVCVCLYFTYTLATHVHGFVSCMMGEKRSEIKPRLIQIVTLIILYIFILHPFDRGFIDAIHEILSKTLKWNASGIKFL